MYVYSLTQYVVRYRCKQPSFTSLTHWSYDYFLILKKYTTTRSSLRHLLDLRYTFLHRAASESKFIEHTQEHIA